VQPRDPRCARGAASSDLYPTVRTSSVDFGESKEARKFKKGRQLGSVHERPNVDVCSGHEYPYKVRGLEGRRGEPFRPAQASTQQDSDTAGVFKIHHTGLGPGVDQRQTTAAAHAREPAEVSRPTARLQAEAKGSRATGVPLQATQTGATTMGRPA
jgi:hypothetical protein